VLRNKLSGVNDKIEAEAKNVIFFLGDGMSVPTITAARIYKGQKVDQLPYGEEATLHMDSFPNVGVSKVFYNLVTLRSLPKIVVQINICFVVSRLSVRILR